MSKAKTERSTDQSPSRSAMMMRGSHNLLARAIRSRGCPARSSGRRDPPAGLLIRWGLASKLREVAVM